MNRIYEEMFIVRPDVTDEELNPLVDQLRGVVTTAGGTIDKEDRMGVRRLAYVVQKRKEGYYVLLQFTSAPTVVKEVERRLRVSDLVMKFITVRMDEHMKRAEKLRKKKEARAARRPTPPPAAPAMPTFAEPPASGSAMPGAPMPGAPAPGAPEPTPTEAVSADVAPVEQSPAETAPVQADAVEATPVETTPVETTTTPDEGGQ